MSEKPNEESKVLNPPIKPGDRIRLVYMSGESLRPGIWGTVGKRDVIQGIEQYEMSWDDGDEFNVGERISSYSLIPSEDKYTKMSKKKSIQETTDINTFIRNKDFVKYFKMGEEKTLPFLVGYLKTLRKTGITNMFAAAPFLYMGREYIDRHYGDQNPDEESFEELLDKADDARTYMIGAAMNIIKDKGQSDEEIDRMLNRVERYVQDLSKRVLQFYLTSF